MVVPESFSVDTQDIDEILQVTVSGSLSDDQTSVLRDAMTAAFDRKPERIAIELTGVDYISSSGIGMLVSMQKKSTAEKCHLILCGLNAELLELFALTRLDQVFTIAESLAAWRESATLTE